MSSSSTTDFLKRPIICGIVAGVLDNYLLETKDGYRNAQFGLSVSAAVAIADATSGSLLKALNVGSNNAGIALRISEVVFASGTAYAVNKYIMGNSSYSYYGSDNSDFMKRVGVIALADVATNAILDLVDSKPVSLFS